MTDFNRVVVHGRITGNAQTTTSDSGLLIVHFAIGTNRTRRLPDGTFADESSFFPLAVFGSYAQLVLQRIVKGQGVTVEGHLKQNRWEKNGEKHSETSITVDRLYFDADIRKKREGEAAAYPAVPPLSSETAALSALQEPVPVMQNVQTVSETPPELMENFDIY